MDPSVGLVLAAVVTGVFSVLSTRRRLGKNSHGDIATMLGALTEHLGELRGELREHAEQDKRVQAEIFERLEAMK